MVQNFFLHKMFIYASLYTHFFFNVLYFFYPVLMGANNHFETAFLLKKKTAITLMYN